MHNIIPVDDSVMGEFVAMALELWSDNDEKTFTAEMADTLADPEHHAAFLYAVDGHYIAFVLLSIRSDYVEGSDSSPVGYVEGIYVKPPHRLKGISKELVRRGERWTKEKGCVQMGSDIEQGNDASYQFHLKAGFKEANRISCFIKTIE
ncbi:aminoglycoside 6'-N-acetyltransferase [Paenibacillus sp. NPDC058071]|uniref:aminoglycoside 6'-N-acetyltransferase n=1 Tax=Paenibacillus sp. NPDC058071 TaxID=3346326 RepID=UPI0036DA9887